MRDLTDVATEGNWTEVVNPPSLLESCTLDGKIYCVPVNIHSWQWLWLSNKAFEDAGVPVPTNWDEFVAAAPALEAAGKIPLAHGQAALAGVGRLQRACSLALGGTDLYNKIFVDKDAEVAAGPEMAAIWQGRRRRAQDGGEVERPGLEPGDQPGHHRPGRRPDHGRLGAGRVPGRRRGRRHRTTPACPGLGVQRGARHRRRRLLLPAGRGRGDLGGAGRARPRDARRRRPRSPSTSRRARCRCAATSTSPPPTTA